MESKGRSYYDDMNPGTRTRDLNDRKFRLLKRFITILILLFVAASVVGIVVLLRNPLPDPSEQTDSLLLSAGEMESEEMLGEVLMEVVGEQLNEEQRAAVAAVGVAISSGETLDAERAADDMTFAGETAAVETPPPAGAEPGAVEEESGELENGTVADDTDTASEESPDAADDGELPEVVQYRDYSVTDGDTISSIAKQFSLLPETIVGVNEIDDINQIRTGTVLKIPDRDGQIYTVKTGDSLSLIAYSYNMGYVPLAEVNGLTSSVIHPGDKLFIPEVTISEETFKEVMRTLFIVPAAGAVTIGFDDQVENVITGEREKSRGIYIRNTPGTEVVATGSGRVTETGNIRSDLGKYVRIAHDNGYVSIYGHLDEILVANGVAVNQGDLIGYLGSTGRTLEPALYFELQKQGEPIDPQQYF